MRITKTVSESQKKPQLLHLGNNLYVLSFYVMKLLPAIHMLEKARQEKLLDEQTLVVETSSGSFAYGIALACTELGLRFKIVSENYKMDSLLLKQLLNQNGEVLIVQNPAAKGGMQQARLDRLYKVMKEEPNSYWPCQYDNPSNGGAYRELGVTLADILGNNLALVGTVGSGGSTCGLIEGIREKNNKAVLVGVDTFNSILFGQDNGPRLLGGLGNSIMPKNLVHEKFDQVHWVAASEAFSATLQLHKQYGLFGGPTTGAAFIAAQWNARQFPDRNVVFISPDTGHRYVESVYNPAWGHFCNAPYPSTPQEVAHPKQNEGTWSYYTWNRRSLEDVVLM